MIKTIGVIGAGSVGSALISELYKRDPENIYVIAKNEGVLYNSHNSYNNNECFLLLLYKM